MLPDLTLKKAANYVLVFSAVYVMAVWQFQPTQLKDSSLFSVLDASIQQLNANRLKGTVLSMYHPYFKITWTPGTLPQDPCELVIQPKPGTPFTSPLILRASLMRDKDQNFRVVYQSLEEDR